MAVRAGGFGLVVLLLAIGGVGCIESSPSGGGFAIYLPADEIAIGEMVISSPIELREQPLLSAGDIVGYDAQTHTIELTPAAYARLDPQELPGKPFIVCLGREPIYTGTFVSPVFCAALKGLPSSSHRFRERTPFASRPAIRNGRIFSPMETRGWTRASCALWSALAR